jgi:hypothetical protein
MSKANENWGYIDQKYLQLFPCNARICSCVAFPIAFYSGYVKK